MVGIKQGLQSALRVAVLCTTILGSAGIGDEVERSDGWLISRADDTGHQLMTFELTLHPQTEPRPG